jgi:hypothetical protein
MRTHLGWVQHIGVPVVSCPPVQLACFPAGQDTEHALHALVAGALHDVPGAAGNGALIPADPPGAHEHMEITDSKKTKSAGDLILVTQLCIGLGEGAIGQGADGLGNL